jgi:carbon-monoxide dehydrogenase medium subunit
LVSVRGERSIKLEELLLGPGETDIAPDELIHHVSFSRLPSNAKSVYLKVGNRRGMACAVASAAVMLVLDQEGCVDQLHIALGAVSPRAIRCPITEGLLKGRLLTDNLITRAAFEASFECSPIDDVRATTSYRKRIVSKLINRGLRIAWGKED